MMMMKKPFVILALLVAQPVHASTCHKYSRWYYPYPQTCRNNKYTAEFKFFNNLKFKRNIQPASLEAPVSALASLKWSATSPFPQVEVTPNIVCTIKIVPVNLGLCLLRIEMEKRHGAESN
jgi:hypothetical protein